MSSVVAEAENLYRNVVTDPHAWPDESIADWSTMVSQDAGVSRTQARDLRRIVRMAQRLRDFWTDDGRLADESVTWQSRVDLAAGPKAWRPILALAMEDLERSRSFEAFDQASSLFQVVNNAPFMDGIEYDAWLADNRGNGELG